MRGGKRDESPRDQTLKSKGFGEDRLTRPSGATLMQHMQYGGKKSQVFGYFGSIANINGMGKAPLNSAKPSKTKGGLSKQKAQNSLTNSKLKQVASLSNLNEVKGTNDKYASLSKSKISTALLSETSDEISKEQNDRLLGQSALERKVQFYSPPRRFVSPQRIAKGWDEVIQKQKPSFERKLSDIRASVTPKNPIRSSKASGGSIRPQFAQDTDNRPKSPPTSLRFVFVKPDSQAQTSVGPSSPKTTEPNLRPSMSEKLLQELKKSSSCTKDNETKLRCQILESIAEKERAHEQRTLLNFRLHANKHGLAGPNGSLNKLLDSESTAQSIRPTLYQKLSKKRTYETTTLESSGYTRPKLNKKEASKHNHKVPLKPVN